MNFHDALLNLLDSAPGKMQQQLIDEARSQRADFALDAHNREGKTALDLAVRYNDTEFADYFLRHGAHPERASLTGASADMQTLVTRWRLKTLLYADRGEAPQRPGKFSSFFKCLHAWPCNQAVHTLFSLYATLDFSFSRVEVAPCSPHPAHRN